MSDRSTSIPIRGLFETHLTVKNLDRSIAFYRDALGLELAYRVKPPGIAFFWVSKPRQAMLGLWESPSSPNIMRLHTAFECALEDVLAAPARLKAAGIPLLDFTGQPTDDHQVISWMPAVAVYFPDPDGHLLEYIAPLDEPPRPELGVIPLSQWRQKTRETKA